MELLLEMELKEALENEKFNITLMEQVLNSVAEDETFSTADDLFAELGI